MTDTAATWGTRGAAKDLLATMPPKDVLPILLPYIGQDMPSGGFCNSGGREMDKEFPVEWQTFHAVSRSWRNQDALPKDTGGALLLVLLKQASTSTARVIILDNITRIWVCEAEKPLAAILNASDENMSVRMVAAQALILQGKSDYRDLLLVECSNASGSQNRNYWFDLLTARRCKFRTGIDPKIVKMGFDLILKVRKSSSFDDHDDGYFIAVKVGDYIGQRFMPDQAKPEYQGERGLSESEKYRRDTITRALGWWSANKGRMEKELETK